MMEETLSSSNADLTGQNSIDEQPATGKVESNAEDLGSLNMDVGMESSTVQPQSNARVLADIHNNKQNISPEPTSDVVNTETNAPKMKQCTKPVVPQPSNQSVASTNAEKKGLELPSPTNSSNTEFQRSYIIFRYSDDTFTCDHCHLSSKSTRAFEEHIAKHIKQLPYVCLECRANFRTKQMVDMHIKTSHTEANGGLKGLKQIKQIFEKIKSEGAVRIQGFVRKNSSAGNDRMSHSSPSSPDVPRMLSTPSSVSDDSRSLTDSGNAPSPINEVLRSEEVQSNGKVDSLSVVNENGQSSIDIASTENVQSKIDTEELENTDSSTKESLCEIGCVNKNAGTENEIQARESDDDVTMQLTTDTGDVANTESSEKISRETDCVNNNATAHSDQGTNSSTSVVKDLPVKQGGTFDDAHKDLLVERSNYEFEKTDPPGSQNEQELSHLHLFNKPPKESNPPSVEDQLLQTESSESSQIPPEVLPLKGQTTVSKDVDNPIGINNHISDTTAMSSTYSADNGDSTTGKELDNTQPTMLKESTTKALDSKINPNRSQTNISESLKRSSNLAEDEHIEENDSNRPQKQDFVTNISFGDDILDNSAETKDRQESLQLSETKKRELRDRLAQWKIKQASTASCKERPNQEPKSPTADVLNQGNIAETNTNKEIEKTNDTRTTLERSSRKGTDSKYPIEKTQKQPTIRSDTLLGLINLQTELQPNIGGMQVQVPNRIVSVPLPTYEDHLKNQTLSRQTDQVNQNQGRSRVGHVLVPPAPTFQVRQQFHNTAISNKQKQSANFSYTQSLPNTQSLPDTSKAAGKSSSQLAINLNQGMSKCVSANNGQMMLQNYGQQNASQQYLAARRDTTTTQPRQINQQQQQQSNYQTLQQQQQQQVNLPHAQQLAQRSQHQHGNQQNSAYSNQFPNILSNQQVSSCIQQQSSNLQVPVSQQPPIQQTILQQRPVLQQTVIQQQTVVQQQSVVYNQQVIGQGQTYLQNTPVYRSNILQQNTLGLQSNRFVQPHQQVLVLPRQSSAQNTVGMPPQFNLSQQFAPQQNIVANGQCSNQTISQPQCMQQYNQQQKVATQPGHSTTQNQIIVSKGNDQMRVQQNPWTRYIAKQTVNSHAGQSVLHNQSNPPKSSQVPQSIQQYNAQLIAAAQSGQSSQHYNAQSNAAAQPRRITSHNQIDVPSRTIQKTLQPKSTEHSNAPVQPDTFQKQQHHIPDPSKNKKIELDNLIDKVVSENVEKCFHIWNHHLVGDSTDVLNKIFTTFKMRFCSFLCRACKDIFSTRSLFFEHLKKHITSDKLLGEVTDVTLKCFIDLVLMLIEREGTTVKEFLEASGTKTKIDGKELSIELLYPEYTTINQEKEVDNEEDKSAEKRNDIRSRITVDYSRAVAQALPNMVKQIAVKRHQVENAGDNDVAITNSPLNIIDDNNTEITANDSSKETTSNDASKDISLDKKKGGLFLSKDGDNFTCGCGCITPYEYIFRAHIWKHLHLYKRKCQTCPIPPRPPKEPSCHKVEELLNSVKYGTSLNATIKSEHISVKLEPGIHIKQENKLGDSVLVISDDEDLGNEADETNKKDAQNVPNVIESATSDNNKTSSTAGEILDTDTNQDDANVISKQGESIQKNLQSDSVDKKNGDDGGKEDGRALTQKSDDPEAKRRGGREQEQGNKSSTTTKRRSSGSEMQITISESYTLVESEKDVVEDVSTSEIDKTKKDSDDKKDLAVHRASDHKENTNFYKCWIRECGYSCSTPAEYHVHLTKSHGKLDTITCVHCGQIEEDIPHLFRHFQSFHLRKPTKMLFSCYNAMCQFDTNSLKAYSDHIGTCVYNDSKITTFPCNKCENVYPSNNELIKHLQENTLKFVKCPVCPVTGSDKREILKHIGKVHPQQSRQICVFIRLVCKMRKINNYERLLQNTCKEDIQQADNTTPSNDHHANSPEIIAETNDCTSAQQSDLNLAPLQTLNTAKRPYFCVPDPRKEMEKQINALDSNTISVPQNAVNIAEDKQNAKEVSIEPKSHLETTSLKGDVLNEKQYSVNELNISLEHKGLSRAEIAKKVEEHRFHKCQECSFVSKNKLEIKMHLKVHDRSTVPRDRRFVCALCPTGTDTLKRFQAHMGAHVGNHSITLYCCKKCQYIGNMLEYIKDHGHTDFSVANDVTVKEISCNVPVYFCDKCTYCTDNLAVFNLHLSTHQNEDDGMDLIEIEDDVYTCDKCGIFVASTEVELKQHFEVVHPKEINRNKQNVDDATTKTNSKRTVQQQQQQQGEKDQDDHSSEASYDARSEDTPYKSQVSKRFACKDCEKGFATIESLQEHISIHSEKRQYLNLLKCCHCDYRSTGREWVRRHMVEKHKDKLGQIVKLRHRLDKKKNQSSPTAKPVDTNKKDSTNSCRQKRPFYIPPENVFSEEVRCTECNYFTQSRAMLIIHITNRHNATLYPCFKQGEDSPTKSSTSTVESINEDSHVDPCTMNSSINSGTEPEVSSNNANTPVTEMIINTTLEPQSHKPSRSLTSDSVSGHTKSRYHRIVVTPIDEYLTHKKKAILACQPVEKTMNTSQPDNTKEVKERSSGDLSNVGSSDVTESNAVTENDLQSKSLNADMPPTEFVLGSDILHMQLRSCFQIGKHSDDLICVVCKRSSFKGRYSLHKHILKHFRIGFYTCGYCSREELEWHRLCRHSNRSHSEKEYKYTIISKEEIINRLNKGMHKRVSNIQALTHQFTKGDGNDSPSTNENLDEERENIEVEKRTSKENDLSSDENIAVIAMSSDDPSDDDSVDKMDLNSSHVEKQGPSPSGIKLKISVSKSDIPVSMRPSVLLSPVSMTQQGNFDGINTKPKVIRQGNIFRCNICQFKAATEQIVSKHLQIHMKDANRSKIIPPRSKQVDGQVTPKNNQTTTSPTNVGQKAVKRKRIPCIHCTHYAENKDRLEQHILKKHPSVVKERKENKLKQLETAKLMSRPESTESNLKATTDKTSSVPDANIKTKSKHCNASSEKISKSKGDHNMSTTKKRKTSGNSRKMESKMVFKCHGCHKSFSNKLDIFEHFKKDPFCQQMFRCPMCSFVDIGRITVQDHIKQDHGLARTCIPHVCTKFEQIKIVLIGTNKEEQQVENKVANKRRGTTNSTESFGDQSISDNYLHIDDNDGEYFRCKICGYHSTNREVIYRHIQVHGDSKERSLEKTLLFECQSCQSTFTNLSNTFRHIDHEKLCRNLFMCPLCEMNNNNHSLVEQHINKEHPNVNNCEPQECSRIEQVKAIYRSRYGDTSGDESDLTEEDTSSQICGTEDTENAGGDDDDDDDDEYVMNNYDKEESASNSGAMNFSKKGFDHIVCVQCMSIYASTTAFQNHRNKKHQNTKFQCGFCTNFISRSLTHLISHVRHEHKRKTLKFSLTKIPNLDEVKESEKYSSDDLSMFKRYPKASNMIEKTKADPPMFKCLVCFKELELFKSLHNHVYVHYPKIFKCPECSYRQYPRGKCSGHIKRVHKIDTVPINIMEEIRKHQARWNKGNEDETKNSESIKPAICKSPTEDAYSEEEAVITKRRKLSKKRNWQRIRAFDDESESSDDEDVVKPKRKKPKIQVISETDSSDSETDIEGTKIEEVVLTNKIQKYRCHLCGFIDQSRYQYLRHLVTHGGFMLRTNGSEVKVPTAVVEGKIRDAEVLFSCCYCQYCSDAPFHIKQHVRRIHPDMIVDYREIKLCKNVATELLVAMTPSIHIEDVCRMGTTKVNRLFEKEKISVTKTKVNLPNCVRRRTSSKNTDLGIPTESPKGNNVVIIGEQGRSLLRMPSNALEESFDGTITNYMLLENKSLTFDGNTIHTNEQQLDPMESVDEGTGDDTSVFLDADAMETIDEITGEDTSVSLGTDALETIDEITGDGTSVSLGTDALETVDEISEDDTSVSLGTDAMETEDQVFDVSSNKISGQSELANKNITTENIDFIPEPFLKDCTTETTFEVREMDICDHTIDEISSLNKSHVSNALSENESYSETKEENSDADDLVLAVSFSEDDGSTKDDTFESKKLSPYHSSRAPGSDIEDVENLIVVDTHENCSSKSDTQETVISHMLSDIVDKIANRVSNREQVESKGRPGKMKKDTYENCSSESVTSVTFISQMSKGLVDKIANQSSNCDNFKSKDQSEKIKIDTCENLSSESDKQEIIFSQMSSDIVNKIAKRDSNRDHVESKKEPMKTEVGLLVDKSPVPDSEQENDETKHQQNINSDRKNKLTVSYNKVENNLNTPGPSTLEDASEKTGTNDFSGIDSDDSENIIASIDNVLKSYSNEDDTRESIGATQIGYDSDGFDTTDMNK